MQKLFIALSRAWVALASGLVMVLFWFSLSMVFMQVSTAMPASVVKLQLAFTVERFQEALAVMGEAGRVVYIATMWLDFFFPAAYGVFLASLIALLIRLRREKTYAMDYAVVLMPLGAALLDWAENTGHLVLLGQDVPGAAAIGLVSAVSALKWLLVLASVVVLAINVVKTAQFRRSAVKTRA